MSFNVDMKWCASISLLSMLAAGCASTHTNNDSLQSLHQSLTHKLAKSCEIGPIVPDGLRGQQFQIVPKSPPNSSVTISVYQRPYFEADDWAVQYEYATNKLDELLGRTNAPDTQAASEMIETVELLRSLPEYSYEHMGVDVALSPVDENYAGRDEEVAVAQQVIGEITALLRRYKVANQPLEQTSNPAGQ